MLAELVLSCSLALPPVQVRGAKTPSASAHLETSLPIHDLHTGALLSSLKGHNFPIDSQSLDVVHFDGRVKYIVACAKDRTQIVVWGWSKEQILHKFTVASTCSCLSVSNGGEFLAAGTGDGKILLWDLSSGSLIKIIEQAHYGKVRLLRFTQDVMALISGGDDGNTSLWMLSSLFESDGGADGLVSFAGSNVVKPWATFNQHSLPVTDIHVGMGPFAKARMYSASLDRTIKIFHLSTSTLLATLLFPTAIRSIAIDSTETHILAGGADGKIYKVPLYRQQENSSEVLSIRPGINDVTGDYEATFIGHEAPITAITISFDNMLLVSGDEFGEINVWDIASGANLKKVSAHKGPITALKAFLKPQEFGDPNYRGPLPPIPTLQRSVWTSKAPYEPMLVLKQFEEDGRLSII